MLENTLKEMADKAVEAFTTGYVQLEPINTLSQATGGVAASDWQIIQEINQDKAIIQELNISAKTDVAASEGHCESCNIIVDDCDTCVLHRLGDGYEQITKCAIEKSADTSRCTFGSIPENCPLIKNDIVFKLKKGARVMSPIEGQEE